MTDWERIAQGIEEAKARNGEISTETARLIASQYHGGQGTRLYAFASTGVLTDPGPETWRELIDEYEEGTPPEKEAMNYLGTYFIFVARGADAT